MVAPVMVVKAFVESGLATLTPLLAMVAL
jgi:hypothetical protein